MIKDEMEKFPHWQTLLAPRLVLGIWHVSLSIPHRRILARR
jgi:hypothetical protein